MIGLTAWGCALDKKGGFGGNSSGPGAGGGGSGGDGGGQPPLCGNGLLDPDEQCDDGNVVAEDGCDAACQVECVLPEELEGDAFKHETTHHCYLFIHDVVAIDDPARPWYDARYLCRAHGFELAAITTPDEYTFITGFTDPGPEVWIGGNDLDADDMFGWTTGETAEPAPWESGEPSDSSDPEHCIEIRQDGLNNQQCLEPRAYLCERHPPGPCGDGVIDAAEECDDGDDEPNDGCTACMVDCENIPGNGLRFEDPRSHHCYIYDDNSTSWAEALAACEGIPDFHFATLSSAEERDFILSNPVVAGAWVGATDGADEDVWLWSNEEPWEFIPWQQADIMNHSSKDCLRFQFDGLTAADCAEMRQYLCEREPKGKRSPAAP